MNRLSGRAWWVAHQDRYPNSRDVNDLDEDFRANLIRFINCLKKAGALVSIKSTRRNAIRAYLMHYCWRIANEDFNPSDVPQRAGVDIQWDHGNDEASRKAANEMVSLFGLAFKPSLASNHIRGTAIDMDIRWSKDLFLGPLPTGGFRGVVGGPRTGARNRDLHEIGESFGVRKLLNDPPHWSYNGR